MKKYIGVDIGGTYSRFGVVTPDGEIERMIKIPSGGENSLTPQTLASTILQLIKDRSVSGVGIGVPGVVLPNGEITLTTNLEQLEGIELKGYLEQILQLPVCVENDGNAAGLAEALLGAGRGRDLVYYVTISTGIGGAFIRRGEICHGKAGFAGEIGSMIVHLSGKAYRGLYPGMVEGMAGGEALRALAGERMGTDFPDAGEVFRSAREGSREARCLIDQMEWALAAMFSNLTYTIAPDVFILGGGCMKASDDFLGEVLKRYQEMVPYEEARALFLKAELEEPGVLGAGMAAARMLEEPD